MRRQTVVLAAIGSFVLGLTCGLAYRPYTITAQGRLLLNRATGKTYILRGGWKPYWEPFARPSPSAKPVDTFEDQGTERPNSPADLFERIGVEPPEPEKPKSLYEEIRC